MAFTSYRRPMSEILTDVFGQTAALVQKQGQLARAEISEKVGNAAVGAGIIAAGAVLLIPAFVILLGAVVSALVAGGLSPTLAALLVGGIVLIIGLALVAVGAARLRSDALVPQRTIDQLKKDATVASEVMREDRDQQRAA